jgi:hypothetical protein
VRSEPVRAEARFFSPLGEERAPEPIRLPMGADGEHLPRAAGAPELFHYCNREVQMCGLH